MKYKLRVDDSAGKPLAMKTVEADDDDAAASEAEKLLPGLMPGGGQAKLFFDPRAFPITTWKYDKDLRLVRDATSSTSRCT